jgi:hypothetical protein
MFSFRVLGVPPRLPYGRLGVGPLRASGPSLRLVAPPAAVPLRTPHASALRAGYINKITTPRTKHSASNTE